MDNSVLADVVVLASEFELLSADMLTRRESGIMSVKGRGLRIPRLKDLIETKGKLDAEFERLING